MATQLVSNRARTADCCYSETIANIKISVQVQRFSGADTTRKSLQRERGWQVFFFPHFFDRRRLIVCVWCTAQASATADRAPLHSAVCADRLSQVYQVCTFLSEHVEPLKQVLRYYTVYSLLLEVHHKDLTDIGIFMASITTASPKGGDIYL